ncbi:MAG: hemolysin family protein [Candidatus Brocadiia bacterium]
MYDFMSQLPLHTMLVVAIALLPLSFFFSATEIAMFTFRKSKLAMLVKQNNKGALLINRIMQKPDKLLSTILVGNNLVNIAITALATTIFLAWFGEKGLFISMAVTTFVLIEFGEITPKVLSSQYWEKFAFACARPIYLFSFLFYPFIQMFSSITRVVTYIFNIKIQYRKPMITKEEIKHIVELSSETGHLGKDEVTFLQNVLKFTDQVISDVMVPRDKIVALDANIKPEEATKFVTEKHYTRIPIYEGNLDNIVGILHTKDYFNVICYQNLIVMDDLLREPFFVSEEDKISDVLKKLQTNRVHLALVRDSHNKITGLVTIENILEEIVGDIMDEYK